MVSTAPAAPASVQLRPLLCPMHSVSAAQPAACSAPSRGLSRSAATSATTAMASMQLKPPPAASAVASRICSASAMRGGGHDATSRAQDRTSSPSCAAA